MRRLLCTLATVLSATLTLAAAGLQTGSTRTAVETPEAKDIERAIAIVKADPNLATHRTLKVLRWNQSARSGKPSLPAWLGGLMAWLNESTRMLWWLAAAALVGVLVVYVIRIIRARSPSTIFADTFVAPTHVHDLDIRPEALPEDVGAAARAMWDRGQGRAALALLYRGMLSRLAYVHRVPIRDSSTEGECLLLSVGHLPAVGSDYASRLVTVWQRAVYAGEQASTASVHRLCLEFGPALNCVSEPQAPTSAAGA